MKKLSMKTSKKITFYDGCEMYIQNCRQRNLREGTINHYKQSYTQFYKIVSKDTPLESINQNTYNEILSYFQKNLTNDVSINAYIRDLITTFKFLMKEDLLSTFEMKRIRVTKPNIETYTDKEIELLLAKPNLKTCSFTEYKCWVMVNFLFSTGVRQRSLNNIKIKDIDFDNEVIYINVTKNRKPLIIPLSSDMLIIFKEYLQYRQHKNINEYLFCNVFGKQLTKSTGYHMLYEYNKRRGVETTGIHRFRHTFAKHWILSGGSIVSLSRLLGHSSLTITENYIHLLTTDFAQEVNEINLLSKFTPNKYIKM